MKFKSKYDGTIVNIYTIAENVVLYTLDGYFNKQWYAKSKEDFFAMYEEV